MQEHTQSTTQYPGVIDINEYEYMDQKLYNHDNHWVIAGTEKKFRTCLEAERYIRNVLNKAKQETGADFIRDIVLEKLEQLEKIML